MICNPGSDFKKKLFNLKSFYFTSQKWDSVEFLVKQFCYGEHNKKGWHFTATTSLEKNITKQSLIYLTTSLISFSISINSIQHPFKSNQLDLSGVSMLLHLASTSSVLLRMFLIISLSIYSLTSTGCVVS